MHLTRDEIVAALTAAGNEAASSHLATCSSCSAVADDVALDLGLDDELAWQLARLPELPRDDRPADLEAFAGELLARGIAAGELVRDPRLAGEEGLAALLRASHVLLNVEPVRLRELADAVLAVKPSDAVRVVALRELANAQRRTGDLAGALSSIERGRETALRLATSEHESAIFDYIEAVVLVDRSRLTEARALAERALVTFRRFGDTRRELYARLALGGIDYEVGALESARAAFLSLAEPLARLGDRAASLSVIQNAGDCSLQLHDLDAARRQFLEAKEGYEELGLTTPLLSIDWLLGRVAVGEGRYDDAEEAFVAVAQGHDMRGMKLDAALTRLDLVDLYRTTGRQDDAIALARGLASVFAAAGARGRLADALTVLREAVEHGATLDEPLREAREALAAAPPSAFHS